MSARIRPLAVCLFVCACFDVSSASAQTNADNPPSPPPGLDQGIDPRNQAQPQQPLQVFPGLNPVPGMIQQQAATLPAEPVQQAPFQLNPGEEAALDRLLTDWQTMSAQVKTFESKFWRFDYDGVFGDGKTAKRQVQGVLKYAAPDKGYYELSDGSEKWICTGKAIFEFRGDLKPGQVREYPLPPQMQGQAIADGPMPFVFGVEAAKMKARYWMRIVAPPAPAPDQPPPPPQVWLEAFPKHAKDTANFQKIDVILSFEVKDGTVTKLEPYALNMVLPNGKDRTAYRFVDLEVNTMLNNLNNFFNIFVRPSTPIGWQHHVIDDSAPAGPEGQPQARPPVNVGDAPQPTVPR